MKRATTRAAKFGATAEAIAPTTRKAATSQYTRLRPSRSATRPKTHAPTTLAASVTLISRLSWCELRCHCCLIRTEVIPMMNRSYASVKNPIPETRTARRWNLLSCASLSESIRPVDRLCANPVSSPLP